MSNSANGACAMLYIYACNAIDFWDGWQTLDRLQWHDDGWGEDTDATRLLLLANRVRSCGAGFRQYGWEGDVRSGHWMVSGLPDPDSATSRLMFAVKQDNNGTTFLASELPLPWLGESFCGEWQ